MHKSWLNLMALLWLSFLLTGCISQTGTQQKSEEPEAEPKGSVVFEKIEGLTAHFIDVGQGDATLLEFDGYTLLIDTGNWNGEETVRYLKSQGIEQLDIVVGTHPDADHIGQLDQVIEQFEVQEVWMSGNPSPSSVFIRALEAIDAKEIDYYEPRAGETFDVGPMEIEVLYPEEVTGKANEESVSLKLTYGEIRFVFTGDAGVKEEQEMIDRGLDLDAEILQMGHHGSNTSTGTAFLKAVSPEVAIYSAGIDNSYGHPHAEVLAAVENAGAKVYGTDVHGTIRIETDGTSYRIATKQEGTPVEGKNRCININIASSSELQEIEGIGPAFAEDIIEARPFETIEELAEIKGIGQGTVEAINEQGLACIGE